MLSVFLTPLRKVNWNSRWSPCEASGWRPTISPSFHEFVTSIEVGLKVENASSPTVSTRRYFPFHECFVTKNDEADVDVFGIVEVAEFDMMLDVVLFLSDEIDHNKVKFMLSTTELVAWLKVQNGGRSLFSAFLVTISNLSLWSGTKKIGNQDFFLLFPFTFEDSGNCDELSQPK